MLRDCARILLKRWIWVAVALVAALAAGATAYSIVGPTQKSTAEVLFVPSTRQPGVAGQTNPFRLLDTSLSVIASIVQTSVMDDKVASRLVQAGDTAKYTIAPNLAPNSGPTLLVTVDDKSGPMTDRTLKAVLGQIQTSLRTLQADRNTPPDQFITAVVLTQSAHPVPSHKAQIQAAVVAVVAVAFLLIIVILLIERRLSRRRHPVRTQPVTGNGRGEATYHAERILPVGPPAIKQSMRRSRRKTVSGPATQDGLDALDDQPTTRVFARVDLADDTRP